MPRVVHLGLGNFHRAHQAVYTQLARAAEPGGDPWTITGVAHRRRGVVDALRRQGMGYTVVTLEGSAPDRPERVVVDPVDVLTEAFVLADEPDPVLARLADPTTAVVTLTVTEAGYSRRTDGGLAVDDPAVAADLRGDAPPRTALGALARGLAARADAGAGPLTVVSCDNVPHNGAVVRSVVADFARAAGRPDVADWADEHVGWPSTMVDRIVPITTDATVALVRAAGHDDAVPVPAEPFRQWVLQPDFRAGRPAWEAAGAVLTDDVHAWETVKVRLLNGVHSLIAVLGLLRGHELIATAYADPVVRRAADALGEEYVPTLDRPPELDLDGYRADLTRRFANAALGHRCAQVGTDASLKLAGRVPAAAAWHLDHGRVPSVLALLVAAVLRAGGRPDALGDVPRPADPAGSLLARRGRDLPDPAAYARAVLVDDALLGPDLAGRTAFVDRVAELLGVLDTRGTTDAVAAATAD